MPSKPNKLARLEGLYLARFLALIGMVIVNFSIVMGAETARKDFISLVTAALHGKAAALFVVLAGVGLGLAAKRGLDRQFYVIHYKRAVFLLVVGLLNMLVFDADILHYYAFYFALGLLCLRLQTPVMLILIAAVMALFMIMVIGLDYDAEWNWDDLSYEGFWTPLGFVRNLFFNGWHPVIPWIVFLLWGILLSRLDLRSAKTKLWVFISHGCLFVIANGLSIYMTKLVSPIDAEAALLFTTQPIPPMPLYILVGGSGAAITVSLCLWLSPLLEKIGILNVFTRIGRQSLTLYVAHIYIGMGAIQALGLIGGQDSRSAWLASALFCLAAIVYTYVWSKIFKRGPLEGLMRKITG